MYYESSPKVSATSSSKSLQNKFFKTPGILFLEFRIMMGLKLEESITRIYFNF